MLTERMKALACNLYGAESIADVPQGMIAAMEVAQSAFLKLCRREANNADMIPVCVPWLTKRTIPTVESVQPESVVVVTPPETSITVDDSAPIDIDLSPLPTKKRGGRPPGSKNKPKAVQAVNIRELEVVNG